MVSIATIILFFIYLWGLGFTATYLVKKPESLWEKHALNVGIGLGLFPILSVLLNFLHIPLDWKIFLALSVFFPLFICVKNIRKKKWKFPHFTITKSNIAFLLVLLIALFSLFVYLKGAFSYPYLEDEDPWGHAIGAKYVALEKNAYDPELPGENTIDPALSYIDPYPPAYDILMGVLHQTSPDVNWTLKFFNALIISLGFILFYLFAKKFIGNRNKALLATFIFAVIPSYLSHFIWAHSLAITILFPLLYALLMIKEDRRWMYLALFLVASVWVSQNLDQPLKISTLLLLYLVVISITHKKFFAEGFIALGGGVALSFIWWGTMIYKYTLERFIAYYGGNVVTSEGAAVLMGGQEFASTASQNIFGHLASIFMTLTNPGGSASRAYTFSDFFIARGENMINSPIGIGIGISLLTLVGITYLLLKYRSRLVAEENSWRCISLFWLVFTFWGVNGITFPFSIAKGAFRVWPLLAIPVALLATEGFFYFRNMHKNKLFQIGIAIFLLFGIAATSAYPKYQLNTSVWPTSASFSSGNPAEPFEYGFWFQTIPLNTKVFLYAPRDKLTIGYGAFSCDWCPGVREFRADILHQDAESLYRFLKSQGYEYLLINGNMDSRYFNQQFGANETKELLLQRYSEMLNSGLFTPIYQKEGLFVVFRVTGAVQ